VENLKPFCKLKIEICKLKTGEFPLPVFSFQGNGRRANLQLSICKLQFSKILLGFRRPTPYPASALSSAWGGGLSILPNFLPP
jgi:hypothetical protein